MNIKYIYSEFIILLLGLCLENGDFSGTNRFVKHKNSSINSLKNCSQCFCGVPGNQRRIVGGNNASATKYPWMAMLFYNRRFNCGATLINNNYILTAAHCAQGFSKNAITIRLSSYSISDSSNFVLRNVQSIKIHPQFNQRSYINDLALMKLSSPIEYTNDLYPVCLSSESKNYIGQMGIVIGWGSTAENTQISDNLREVSVPIISNADCGTKLNVNITRNMICAGEMDGNKDSCQGDSGGPMHVFENNKFYEVGIVSFGIGCGRPNLPGVYTRVAMYHSWIMSNTADACYCAK